MCRIINIEPGSNYTDVALGSPRRIRTNALADLNLQTDEQIQVVIEDGIREIGYEAFRDVQNLTAVTISDGVTKIKKRAFYGCIGLSAIVIPPSVTTIGYKAFSKCTSLHNVTINSIMLERNRIGNGVFSYCSNLHSIRIPNNVTRIGHGAFAGCSNLQTINFIPPPGVQISLGDGAFSGCTENENVIAQLFPTYENIGRHDPIMSNEVLIYPPDSDNILDEMVEKISKYYYVLFNRAYIWKIRNGNPEYGAKDEATTVREFSEYSNQLCNACINNNQLNVEQAILDILVWGGFRDNNSEPADFTNAILNVYETQDIMQNDYRFLLRQGHGITTRISFWSKILSAYKPGVYFIYDSRVALALSYISLKINQPCFWCVPSDGDIMNEHFIDYKLNMLLIPQPHDGSQPTVRNIITQNRSIHGNTREASEPVCYDLYIRLLDKLADNKEIQNRYEELDDDIKNAYESAFEFEQDSSIRKKMAIKAHLEKMLFMMKERILMEYQPN